MEIPENYQAYASYYRQGYTQGKRTWELDDAHMLNPKGRAAYIAGFRVARNEDREEFTSGQLLKRNGR